MDYETVDLIVGKPNDVCTLCYGEGILYYGNEEDFTAEPCECKLIEMEKNMSALVAVRPIRDPYEGRGLEFSLRVSRNHKISVCLSAGLSESLVHFDVAVSTPFDVTAINEGNEKMPSWFKRLGIKAGVLFTTFCLEFYWTDLRKDWTVSL